MRGDRSIHILTAQSLPGALNYLFPMSVRENRPAAAWFVATQDKKYISRGAYQLPKFADALPFV